MSNFEDTFSGMRLKLKRARQQLEELNGEFKEFLKADPYKPNVHFDNETCELTVSVYIEKSPDPMWGVRIGEVVHNTRSALDHLVWELVRANTGAPPPTNSRTQFPVFQSKAGFHERGVKKMLHGVRPLGVTLIEEEQPFSTGEGTDSPLWHLNELSNADKHRTLHLTGTLVQDYNVQFPPVVQDIEVARLDIPLPGGPVQEDATLWYGVLKGATGWPFAGPDVEGHLTIDIAFDKRTPAVGGWLVYATLDNALQRTQDVISKVAGNIWGISF